MRGNFDSDFYRDGNRYDVPAALAALVLTALLHVGAYCVVPDEFAHAAPESDDGELKLEILPPKLENRKPEFIEANPFGNDAVPDSPDAPESFKDQRAADEIPDPASKSRKPFVVGENTDSQKIVSCTSSDDDKYSPESVMQTLARPPRPRQVRSSPNRRKRRKPTRKLRRVPNRRLRSKTGLLRGIRLKTAGRSRAETPPSRRSLPTLRKPNKAILPPTKKLPTTPTHFSKFRKNL